MSQDTSHLQVIEKFSFIYTLTHSRDKNTKQLEKKISVDIQEFTDNPEDESDRELVHSSLSDSVTLSSVLGFPNFTVTNGASLCYLDEPAFDYSLDLPGQVTLPAQESQSSSFVTRHLGKIAFLLSSSYLIFVAYWLAGHNYYGRIFPFSALRSIPYISEQQVSASDLQFIDYLKRSLVNIELKQDNQLSNSNTKPESAGVVYVPVYNLTNANSASEKYASDPRYLLNSAVNNSPLPVPIIPPPPPRKLPLSTFPSSSSSISKSSTAKSPSTPPSSSVTTNKSPNSPTTSPPQNYTLIGIFELGKRSAALFRVDGVTKRIWVGDKLDNKGWILDSVANQKAKISRQGEIRSLSIGEKF